MTKNNKYISLEPIFKNIKSHLFHGEYNLIDLEFLKLYSNSDFSQSEIFSEFNKFIVNSFGFLSFQQNYSHMNTVVHNSRNEYENRIESIFKNLPLVQQINFLNYVFFDDSYYLFNPYFPQFNIPIHQRNFFKHLKSGDFKSLFFTDKKQKDLNKLNFYHFIQKIFHVEYFEDILFFEKLAQKNSFSILKNNFFSHNFIYCIYNEQHTSGAFSIQSSKNSKFFLEDFIYLHYSTQKYNFLNLHAPQLLQSPSYVSDLFQQLILDYSNCPYQYKDNMNILKKRIDTLLPIIQNDSLTKKINQHLLDNLDKHNNNLQYIKNKKI